MRSVALRQSIQQRVGTAKSRGSSALGTDQLRLDLAPASGPPSFSYSKECCPATWEASSHAVPEACVATHSDDIARFEIFQRPGAKAEQVDIFARRPGSDVRLGWVDGFLDRDSR